MATPTVIFNSSTGSDTAASGAGPATALSGTAASYSGSVFTLDGSPDLSGVDDDGSHVIWVQTSTGRQFFTISAVDDGADTVTVDDAPAGTTTGLTWGIGGKRATWDNADSRLLFSADAKAGWIIETETDQTIATSGFTLAIPGTLASPATIRSADPDSPSRIICGFNGSMITATSAATYILFEDLIWTVDHSDYTSIMYAYYRHNGVVGFRRCQFLPNPTASGSTDEWAQVIGYGGIGKGFFDECHFDSCGELMRLYGGDWSFFGCLFTDCGDFTYAASGKFIGCIFANGKTASNAITTNNGSYSGGCVIGCTFYNIDNSAIDLGSNTSAWVMTMIANNIFSEISGYGVESSVTRAFLPLIHNNCFYNCSSGSVSSGLTATGSITSDPGFTDAPNLDFSVGANMKAAGWPDSSEPIGIGSATYSFVDIGAAQREEAGGGGGIVAPTLQIIS